MQTIAIPRRALLAAAPAALAFPRSARALPTDTPILFTVLRGGAPIGRHRVAFAQSGATLAVEIEIDLEVRFAEPQSAIAPGQAVVCYDGDRVLCGGWLR